MAALTIPNPNTTPDPWDTLTFSERKTDFVWPPEESYGLVEWSSFKPSVKLDKKAKSGAAKPKVTTTNGKGIDFSFTLRIPSHLDAARDSAAFILDKLRPGAGPFGLKNHPWATLAGVRGFIVEEVDYQPPADGELHVVVSCTQIDPDAQSGTGKSVVSTPSKQAALQRAQDEWLARARQAQAFTNNQLAIDVENLAEQAAANGDSVATRVPKKLKSVFVGEDEVGSTPNVKKKPDPPTNSASGSVNG